MLQPVADTLDVTSGYGIRTRYQNIGTKNKGKAPLIISRATTCLGNCCQQPVSSCELRQTTKWSIKSKSSNNYWSVYLFAEEEETKNTAQWEQQGGPTTKSKQAYGNKTLVVWYQRKTNHNKNQSKQPKDAVVGVEFIPPRLPPPLLSSVFLIRFGVLFPPRHLYRFLLLACSMCDVLSFTFAK